MALIKETYLYDELKNYISKYGYKIYSKQSFKYAGEDEALNTNLQELYNEARVITVSNTFIEFIFEYINQGIEERADLEFWLNNCNIADIYYVLIEKIKVIIKEGLIEEDALYEIGRKLATESRGTNEIKLGLTLLRLCNNENAVDILKVFSIHNEYVFYCLEGIKEYRGANSFIFEVAKISKGYGKFMSICRLEPLTEEIKIWLMEQGSDNDFLETEMVNIILNKVNIEWYVNNTKSTLKKFNILSKILIRLYKGENKKETYYDYDLFYEFVMKFNKYGKKFSHLYALMVIMSFISSRNEKARIDGSLIYTEAIKETESLEEEIRDIFNKIDTTNIIKEEIKRGKESIQDILKVATLMEDRLSYDDIVMVLEKSPFNSTIYRHIMKYASNSSKESIIRFFQEKDYTEEEEDDYNLCLYYIIKNMKELSVEYIDYNIEVLEYGDNKSKKEAFINIQRDELLVEKERLEKIKEFISFEKDETLKRRILKFIDKNINVKEIIVENLKDIMVEPDMKDTFLITTDIVGIQYEQIPINKDDLYPGYLVYLIAEEENLYDDNAIGVITEEGWKLGYIYREDNYILRRLLDAEKKLYGIIEEVKENKINLKVSIFLSKSDVEEEVNDILKMILVESTGLLN